MDSKIKNLLIESPESLSESPIDLILFVVLAVSIGFLVWNSQFIKSNQSNQSCINISSRLSRRKRLIDLIRQRTKKQNTAQIDEVILTEPLPGIEIENFHGKVFEA